MFLYGGYILTGGKLDNGNPWKGIVLMLAEKRDDQEFPFFAQCVKGLYSDSLVKACQSLPIGCPVSVSFVPSGNDKQGNPIFKLNELKRLTP